MTYTSGAGATGRGRGAARLPPIPASVPAPPTGEGRSVRFWDRTAHCGPERPDRRWHPDSAAVAARPHAAACPGVRERTR